MSRSEWKNFESPAGRTLINPQAVRAAVNAFAANNGVGVVNPANEFRGHGVLEMARSLSIRAGRQVQSPAEIFASAVGSADYNDLAALLVGIVETFVLDGFEAAPNSWRNWTRQRLAPTFRGMPSKRALGFDMEVIPEGGEIPVVVAPSEDSEVRDATTRGVIVRIHRQAFINGDLRFVDLARAAGRAAALAVNSDVYELLASNPTLLDTGALFNTTAVTTAGGHANSAASGGAIAAGTLQVGKSVIRKQVGKPGSKPLSLRPRYALVPSLLEDVAWAAIATPFGLGEPGSGQERAMLDAGRLQLIVAPHLDAHSATAWYLAADPADEPLVDVTFIGNDMRPRIAGVRRNFDFDSIDIAVTFDYAVTPGNWRAGYKNAGV